MNRLIVVFATVTLSLMLVVSAGTSQDAKKDEKKKDKVKGMLPPGFKDLGLSKDQVTKIYSIQADFKAKIAELDKAIKEMKAKESADVFKILTDEQREKYLKSKGVDTKKKDSDKKDPDKKGDK
ncbi:MAG: hypothetical protein FJ303_18735 [Planctomycetes bacterium]|nr:hypothetical protein [Planctomycetota bacterium]